VAVVIGESVRLGARQSSRDYLYLYNGDGETLAGSLDRIRRPASVILAAVSVGVASGWQRRAGASVAHWLGDPHHPQSC
jgi:hypothetical protein